MVRNGKNIEIALFERVLAIEPALPIKWPGRAFDPPDDRKYFEIIHFPNDPIDYDWQDHATTFHGILQINLHHPINLGSVVLSEICDNVINNYFAKNTILMESTTRLQIDTVPSVGNIVENAGEVFTPIRVRYRSI